MHQDRIKLEMLKDDQQLTAEVIFDLVQAAWEQLKIPEECSIGQALYDVEVYTYLGNDMSSKLEEEMRTTGSEFAKLVTPSQCSRQSGPAGKSASTPR
ncbi:hypothetical protein CHS0354_038597 [Potamilus streckersoni]|uniref:Uncharacterized protein n=1 Tax=Potamilus streckersoni TaxID=2493646 RepID=A0AAE0WBX0_9BIVA|nr:hypothetical protein CHS0354_038597 [Potamilus streckersoni]